MKKYILYELAKYASRNSNHYQKHRWQKKLKYLAAFAFVGTLLFVGLTIWGTVAVVSSIAGSVNQEGIKAMASQPLTTKNCIDTMGGMLSPTKLLTVPMAQNIESIRAACWDKPKAIEDHQKQS